MKTQKPLVSIVMPVYNAGSFLVEALKSILAQTYQNWELICVDDGSTDESLKILKEYQKEDPRIRVYQNKKNLGVSEAANLAISKAKGDFIARMDADDIAFPQRLEKQVEFLTKNKDVVAVGGQCILINDKSEEIGEKCFPLNNNGLYQMMFTSVPIQQPALIVNRRLLPKNFIWYQNKFDTAEEIDLLFQLFGFGKLANLDENLLYYRVHKNSTSLKNPKKTFKLTFKTRLKAAKQYGYKPTFVGLITNYVQFIIVWLLPSTMIYPVYAVARGLSPLKVEFDLNFVKNLGKRLALSR